jgi:uncharacterized protein YbjT (DUF2867 family)
MTAAKRALVAGATGLVGSHLVQVLLERPVYDKVIVIGRRPLAMQHPKLEQRTVDFERLHDYADAFRVDDIYCALGTTIKKAGSQAAQRKVDYEYIVAAGRLAKQAGAKQFLLVSSMGANAKSGVFYSRLKGETEEALAALNLPTLLIFRPSLLLGDRQEFRFGERAAMALTPVINPLLVGSMRKYRGIHARTVAQAMVNAAQRGCTGKHTFESDAVADMG